MNINDITITSLETINAFDIVTGAFKFTLDELQNATIAQTQEKTDITGKQGRKLNSLKKNKAVTISGTNGLVSGGLLEMQVGSEFENKKTTVKWTDYITVTGNAATTSYKAVGTTGNEIEAVYIKNSSDGTLGDTLTQGAAVAEGVFTYNPETKALSFNEGDIADNTEIVVFYMRQIQADVLENLSATTLASALCTLMLLPRISARMCTASSSTSPRLTSMASSASRWATTRPSMHLRLSLCPVLAAPAALCGLTPSLVLTLRMLPKESRW